MGENINYRKPHRDPIVRFVIAQIGGAPALAELQADPRDRQFIGEFLLALGSDLLVTADEPGTTTVMR